MRGHIKIWLIRRSARELVEIRGQTSRDREVERSPMISQHHIAPKFQSSSFLHGHSVTSRSLLRPSHCLSSLRRSLRVQADATGSLQDFTLSPGSQRDLDADHQGVPLTVVSGAVTRSRPAGCVISAVELVASLCASDSIGFEHVDILYNTAWCEAISYYSFSGTCSGNRSITRIILAIRSWILPYNAVSTFTSRGKSTIHPLPRPTALILWLQQARGTQQAVQEARIAGYSTSV